MFWHGEANNEQIGHLEKRLGVPQSDIIKPKEESIFIHHTR